MSDNSSNKTDVSTIDVDNISLHNNSGGAGGDGLQQMDTSFKFIGFDLSTQQLKALVIDDQLRICHCVSVNFDEELGEYKTVGGAHRSDEDEHQVTAPVNMWLKAMDLCFDKLKVDGLDFSLVLAISGCAQQHGSVWWRRESSSLLANLDPDKYLHEALVSAFSLRDTPIWMDSSTSSECRLLEQHVGGPTRLAQITGSRAYERFTGPQIARIIRQRREVYLVTERITLISNFLASILCGSYVPLDASDASGMNMMHIANKRWSMECLEAIAGDKEPVEGLRARLGCMVATTNSDDDKINIIDENIVDTHEVVGRISPYFVERHGFSPGCLISSFTGDNPGSMAGLCVSRDEVILSLGTSDTAFFWLEQPTPGVNGHVLRNPLEPSQYMGLICFKNGSRTRERLRDTCAQGDWVQFERLLNSVPRGNFGNLAFYNDLREIYPLIQGDFRYNKLGQRVEAFAAPEIEIRACLEGQFMRLYHHSQALGLHMGAINRVLVTGGASVNRAILQVIADVFKKPVYVLESAPNSACLGGAYLAKYAYEIEQLKLDKSFTQPKEPSPSPTLLASQNEHDDETKAATTTTTMMTHEEDQDKQFDFSRMVLGNSGSMGENREIKLVKAADPTPVGTSNGDVYEQLLERYVKLETEMALNNDPSASS